MASTKITTHNQSGGTTANRINSPDIKLSNKIITRHRSEGFIVGFGLAILSGIAGNLIYEWLFR